MKNLSLMKILATLSFIVLPLLEMHQNAYANTSYGTVIAKQLNVREEANNLSKIIGLVHQGETFEILQTKNSWDEIKLSNNQFGWVYDPYLMTNEKTDATVDAIVLRVHKSPSLSSSLVGKLLMGSRITIHQEQAGWAQIVSSSGIHGWVSEKYITKMASSKQTAIKIPASTAKDAPSSKQPVIKTPAPKTKDTSSSKQPVIKTPAPKTKDAVSSELGLFQSTEQPPASDKKMVRQSITTDSLQNNQDSLEGKTIVLDPGHGGKDDGTTSIVGTTEKSLTLLTAQAVEQTLKNAGANVIMTRTDDTYIPLQQRAALSNQNIADAFISFHYNWSDDSMVNGLTDFYYHPSRDNLLASDLLNEVVKTTGLKNDGTKFDDLEVLRDNTQPSTLIELGFLSNKQDDSMVESPAYVNNVAQGVYLGLLDYFSTKQ